MLLRNNEIPDQDIYLNMESPIQQQDPELNTYHAGHEDGTMDDIWGDDDSTTARISSHQTTSYFDPQQSHVSDVPRIKKEHTTAGYRDGVTQAKAASVQSGFDEGFGLGATIGAHAGRLLGVLTGLSSAISSSSHTQSTKEDQRLQDLLKSATEELSVQSIFSETYWESDGTWKYEIVAPLHPHPSSASSRRRALTQSEESRGGLEKITEGDEQGDEEVIEEEEEAPLVFTDIAAAHPLLKKWDGILQQEVERYDLVWDVLLPEDEEAQDQRADAQQKEDDARKLVDVVKDERAKKPVVIQNKGALSW